MSGQITGETALGKELFALGRDCRYRVFVEVGTWKGYGSTKQLVDGCLTRSQTDQQNVSIYSLEANRDFYNTAHNVWSPRKLPFLHLLYGKLHDQGLMPAEQIRSDPLFLTVQSHFNLWYEQDVKDYKACPNVSEQIPKNVDVALIDGGEFCGYADWLALQKCQPEIVVLDDTQVLKTNRILKELLNQPNHWTLVKQGKDRNGWAIFQKQITKA